MTQKRLASTLLTQGSTVAAYTVPAGKSAVVSIFARNIGDDSAVVDLSHSQNTPPADNTAAEQVNTTVYTNNKQAPLGILNLGTTTVKFAVPASPSAGGDVSPSTSQGPIAIWDEASNVAVQPYSTNWGSAQWAMGNAGYWTGRGYQISAFYGENDYFVFNSNRYPRRVKGYPFDSESKNYEGYGTGVFGGYDTAPNYYDYGSAGFRTQMFSVNSSNYLTRRYTIIAGTSSSGSTTDYTSVANSPYGLQQNGYPAMNPYSLSILPTAKGSTANLRLVTGSAATGTTGTTYIWQVRITNESSAEVYDQQSILIKNDWGTTYSQVQRTMLWYRPVGDYVYSASTTKVFRAPITTWYTTPTSWVDVTSSFPTNLNFYFPFIEDKNFYGYTVTTNGDIVSTKDGVTWTKADATLITTGIGSLGGAYTGVKVNSYDQFPVYTSTGKYSSLVGLEAPSMKPDLFEANLTVPSKSHLEHRGIILNAGDKVYARSTNTNTIIDVYGFEE